MNTVLLIAGLYLVSHPLLSQSAIYHTVNGAITFRSEAPLEIITATSKKVEGLINVEAQTFAFSLPVRSFEGFNNGLQRQHFY